MKVEEYVRDPTLYRTSMNNAEAERDAHNRMPPVGSRNKHSRYYTDDEIDNVCNFYGLMSDIFCGLFTDPSQVRAWLRMELHDPECGRTQ